MGYTYSFFDNQTIGADDLNRLTKRFVTGGIADVFANSRSYNLTQLNKVIFSNVTGGVVPETDNNLKVSLSGGNVVISSGSAFFPSGTVVDVDAEGITLPYTPNAVNYVELVSDGSLNKVFPHCSTKLIQGNVVLLAVINADGSITDKRTYAKGKIPSAYASSYTIPYRTFLKWTADEINAMAVKTITLPYEGARGILSYVQGSSSVATLGFALFDTDGNGTEYHSGCTVPGIGVTGGTSKSDTSLVFQNSNDVQIQLSATVKVSGTTLTITPISGASLNKKYLEVHFIIF